MVIELHPEAIKNINDKTDNLIAFVSQIVLPDRKEGALPDLFTTEITELELIEPLGLVNSLGCEVGLYFMHNNLRYGFIDVGYERLISTVQIIRKTKSISQKVSSDFIKKQLFLWCRNKYLNNQEKSFFVFFIDVCEVSITDYESFIPVPYTIISKPFTLGRFEFLTLTEATITKWFAKAIDSLDESKNLIMKQYMQKARQNYQGYAIGIYRCNAEQIKAQEMAYDHLGSILCIFRMLSLANFHHELVNNIYEYGHRMIRLREYFTKKADEDLVVWNSRTFNDGLIFNIDDDGVKLLENGPLHDFGTLLTKDDPNDYERCLIKAIDIYSRHTLKLEIFDKLLYILVAMETMLIRNENEPLTQNLGERLAFLIGHNLEERKDIKKTIAKVYSVRSKFVHHGADIEENKQLFRDFMSYAWSCFTTLIINMQRYTSREQLLDELDNLKLT